MASRDLIMLKLGGSLITDKRAVEFVRQENLEMLSIQIAEALNEDQSLKGNNNFSLRTFVFDRNVGTEISINDVTHILIFLTPTPSFVFPAIHGLCSDVPKSLAPSLLELDIILDDL